MGWALGSGCGVGLGLWPLPEGARFVLSPAQRKAARLKFDFQAQSPK